MVNAQEWLDKEYPLEKRKEIIELDIYGKNLTGSLKLVGFNNLTKLNCSNNQLTNLDVSSCSSLIGLYCSFNQLTGDLTIFSKLLNCEVLVLNNNTFVGSLVSLQQLNKLKELWIINTNLTTGLEYLPESLAEFYCQETELVKELEKFDKPNENNYTSLLKNWKKFQFWKNQGFTQQQINQWINEVSFLESYNAEFVNYLRKKGYKPNTIKLREIVIKESWKDINQNFAYQLRKEWEERKFNHDQTQAWIDAGAKMDDHEFVAWLRDIKKYAPGWITNYKADYQLLNDRFKKYGLCLECKQLNTGDKWCQSCNAQHSQQDFVKWIGSNLKVNEFIQKYQLEATDADKFIEWIPYEQFTDVEYLAEGGFGKVYKAKWTVGSICHWDQSSKQWQREKDTEKDYKEVVLKILNNSQDNTDFLQETANHKIIDDWFNNIVPCYGISQDEEGNYLMVMKYMPEGNLRQYLSKNNSKLSLSDKFNQLVNISRGLKDIHQKNLVHHDFHSGNILKGIEKTACLITDLGLCRPAEETNEEKVYGVMPYVAPEVLQSEPYTQASDIYSFGIVTYEMLSGLPPYYYRAHDVKLGVEICRGLRPYFQLKIPPLLEDLINRCWDANPQNRPTAHELEKVLRTWQEEINDDKDTEFKNQLREAERFNKSLPEIKLPLNYKLHQGAVYHSKLLPTKEITQLMQNFNFQTKASELNTHLIKAKELAQEITVQQKYNDFKKVLKLVLEKSEELETIITTNQLVISEEMKEVLTKIKELKNKSQEKDSAYQELVRKKLVKKSELKELKKIIIIDNQLEEDDLEDVLEDQAEFIKNNTSKRLERTKKKLVKSVSETEINQLCQLQTEITQLELKLNQNIEQSTKQLTQIINNIQMGDISFINTQIDGSVAIGVGQISNGVDFSINQVQDWTDIHSNFTPALITQWTNQNFTCQQCKEWMDIILPNKQATEIHQVEFFVWLRDTKHLTAEECLNYHNLNQLKNEYQAQLLQTQIQIPPKN